MSIVDRLTKPIIEREAVRETIPAQGAMATEELIAQARGRADFCHDRGEVKTPGLLRELADRLTETMNQLTAEATAVERLTEVLAAERDRNERLAGALREADGCFEAALAEGWIAALSEGDIERIRDIWQRRIALARSLFPAALLQEKQP